MRKIKLDTVKELREVELVYREICDETQALIRSIEASKNMHPDGKETLLKAVKDNLTFFTQSKQGVTNMLTKLDEHFKKVSRQEVEDISQFTAFETQRLTENGKLIKERFAELKNIIGSSSQ